MKRQIAIFMITVFVLALSACTSDQPQPAEPTAEITQPAENKTADETTKPAENKTADETTKPAENKPADETTRPAGDSTTDKPADDKTTDDTTQTTDNKASDDAGGEKTQEDAAAEDAGLNGTVPPGFSRSLRRKDRRQTDSAFRRKKRLSY